MGNYDDIINLPHYESKTHPRMSMEKRAAQFSPFAALSGHGDAVREAERLTSEKKILDESQKEYINYKLQIISEKLKEHPLVSITYFCPDTKKAGGSYLTLTGFIKKINLNEHFILMDDETRIPIEQLFDINCSLLSEP